MRVTVPEVASASPARTLVSVVLPAPLRPTRPIRSPSEIRSDVSPSNKRAPTRNCTAVATITAYLWVGGAGNGDDKLDLPILPGASTGSDP